MEDLLEQSFTACMPLLTATTAFGLGRIHKSSPQRCYLHRLCTFLLCHQQQQPFCGLLSLTTRVSQYQRKHSPTHHPNQHPSFTSFFHHILRSIAPSLFKMLAWQSFYTTSLCILFGLPLGLEPSTSYSIHIFTQSVSSFLLRQ